MYRSPHRRTQELRQLSMMTYFCTPLWPQSFLADVPCPFTHTMPTAISLQLRMASPLWGSTCHSTQRKGEILHWPEINLDIKFPVKHMLHANIITHRSHDSHFSQPQPQTSHGNTLVLTSSILMDLSTSLSLTATPRCQSFAESLYPETILQR